MCGTTSHTVSLYAGFNTRGKKATHLRNTALDSMGGQFFLLSWCWQLIGDLGHLIGWINGLGVHIVFLVLDGTPTTTGWWCLLVFDGTAPYRLHRSIASLREIFFFQGLASTRSMMDKSSPIEGIRSIRPCLLYTSPSPRDLSTSRMPSSA